VSLAQSPINHEILSISYHLRFHIRFSSTSISLVPEVFKLCIKWTFKLIIFFLRSMPFSSNHKFFKNSTVMEEFSYFDSHGWNFYFDSHGWIFYFNDHGWIFYCDSQGWIFDFDGHGQFFEIWMVMDGFFIWMVMDETFLFQWSWTNFFTLMLIDRYFTSIIIDRIFFIWMVIGFQTLVRGH